MSERENREQGQDDSEGQIIRRRASEEAPEDPGMGGKDDSDTEGQGFRAGVSEEAPEDPGERSEGEDEDDTEAQRTRFH